MGVYPLHQYLKNNPPSSIPIVSKCTLPGVARKFSIPLCLLYPNQWRTRSVNSLSYFSLKHHFALIQAFTALAWMGKQACGRGSGFLALNLSSHQDNLTKTNPDHLISMTEKTQLVSPYLLDKMRHGIKIICHLSTLIIPSFQNT